MADRTSSSRMTSATGKTTRINMNKHLGSCQHTHLYIAITTWIKCLN